MLLIYSPLFPLWATSEASAIEVGRCTLRETEDARLNAHLVSSGQCQMVTGTIYTLVFGLLFTFCGKVLNILSSSVVFMTSSVCCFLLSSVQFSTMLLSQGKGGRGSDLATSLVNMVLITLDIVFRVVIVIDVGSGATRVCKAVAVVAVTAFAFVGVAVTVVATIGRGKRRSGLCGTVGTVECSRITMSLLAVRRSVLISFRNASRADSIVLGTYANTKMYFFVLVLNVLALGGDEGRARW